MITYVGELTIAAAVPGASQATIAGDAAIDAAMPDLTLRIQALQDTIALPLPTIDFAAQLALAQQILGSVQAAIDLALPVPPDAEQLEKFTDMLGDLTASLGTVETSASLIASIAALLAAVGLHVYAYSGPVNALGGEVTSALAAGLPGGAPADNANALILATSNAATWTAMQSIFKVTP